MRVYVLYLIVFVTEICFSVKLCAQIVSFTTSEKASLKALTISDTSASRIRKEILAKADKSLTEQPFPIAYISTAGRLKGDTIRENSIRSIKDMDKVWALSIAYVFTGEKKYLSKDLEYLRKWASINKASGEPINETKLEPLLEGYDMIRKDVSEEDRVHIDEWLRAIAFAEIQSERKGFHNSYNNVHSHRLKLVGMIAFILNNENFRKYAEDGLKEQIENNLYPDGSSFDFKERDALHYHCYTLDPLLRLAILFKKNGKDYFNYKSPSNTSLKKSVDLLLPYISGKEIHAEYVHSRIGFDKKRSDNGQADYKTGKPFDKCEGVRTLSLALYFDSGYLPYIRKFYHGYGNYLGWRILVHSLVNRN